MCKKCGKSKCTCPATKCKTCGKSKCSCSSKKAPAKKTADKKDDKKMPAFLMKKEDKKGKK